ncbi:VirD4-like conjugal transfer protein, CD1115 family, partial [Enterococcus faecalis]
KQTQIINMYAVTSMLEESGAYPDEKGNTALDTFFNDLPPTSVARKQYSTIKFSQGITRSGIFTETMSKLKNYTNDAIAR